MKKEIEREVKIIFLVFASILLVILVTTTVSAGFFDDIRARLTGKVTQNLDLNITVGVPAIITVVNTSSTIASLTSGPNEGPTTTNVVVNFTVSNNAGAANLNHSSAYVNITNGSVGFVRQSASCENTASNGNLANYTCNITMYWFDPNGDWTFRTYIEDNYTTSAVNYTQTASIGTRTAFTLGPASLAWPGLAPGSTNQTSNNDPLVLNNTGNDNILNGSLDINASNLRGETDPSLALWAANITVHWDTGGGSCTGDGCTECGGSFMNRSFFEIVSGANLSVGNYTIDDGSTGQEELYFCLNIVGAELTEQAYSSANETEWSWIVQIT